MSREESLVAILTSAEQLLRACGWPACRGLPTVAVPIGVVAQVAGAVASVVDSAPDSPSSHQDAFSCPPAMKTDIGLSSHPEGRTEPRVRDAAEGPPGVCAVADCWRGPITPGGVCFEHSAANQRPRPWQRAGLRTGVFAVEQDDG